MVLEILASVAIVSGPIAIYFHSRQVKALFAGLKVSHIEVVKAHVESEVKKAIHVADIAVCDFCQRQVARFEPTPDGKIKCANCKFAGR